jgi:hypothetical protein
MTKPAMNDTPKEIAAHLIQEHGVDEAIGVAVDSVLKVVACGRGRFDTLRKLVSCQIVLILRIVKAPHYWRDRCSNRTNDQPG